MKHSKKLIFGVSLTAALRGLLVEENFLCLAENLFHENTETPKDVMNVGAVMVILHVLKAFA